MNQVPIFARFFPTERLEKWPGVPAARQGRVYADLPHRYFGDLESLKRYVSSLKEIGVNTLLLLPHFLPSFSEYVVKDFEQPCALFRDWKTFSGFMAFVRDLGMDRMIDIPLNHADWQAEHLDRSWFKNPDENGTEAGADDVDADNERVRINWGAFILDNGNADLQQYWLEKVIFPHIQQREVNAIRIDAAWGLDPGGLTRLVRETKARFPQVWFLAENLGMDRLINLARSGIDAGADRFFNNLYWYRGGYAIPTEIYRFFKQSPGKPACTIYSSHDTLMPAMKALASVRGDRYEGMNDKAIHREIVEREGLTSLNGLPPEEREKVLHLMKLEFLLAAMASSDVMFVAGSETGLLERVDVLRSGPAQFSLGITSDLPAFMGEVLRIKNSLEFFTGEGVLIPFGVWAPGRSGLRGFVRSSGDRHLLVAVNTDLEDVVSFRLPKRMQNASNIVEALPEGQRACANSYSGELSLLPGQGTILFTR